MIRQDYFLRLVQELVEALMRLRSLKRRGEFAAALQETDQLLQRLAGDNPLVVAPDLPELISLAMAEEDSGRDQLLLLADLFAERADLLQRVNRLDESHQSRVLALGLYLETLQLGRVALEEVRKTEELIQLLQGSPLSGAVWMRLLSYYEARSAFARAEDVLFDWADSGDPAAFTAGAEFYQRLLAKSDTELVQGDLPREEVVEGRAALARRAGTGNADVER